MAKDVLRILATDHYTFVFRAEEFARPHLDETLLNGQIPASASQLAAILASQGKKVMFVESVERLLEKTTRDAFADLLAQVAADKSWRLVLTCRDYSIDLVRNALLAPAGIDLSVIAVPSLSDDELDEAEVAFPALAPLLSQGSLRSVLRNPYLLDKALQIRWDNDAELPASERELRTVFWSQVVRAEDRRAGGMPQRRENAFIELAVRRARALSAYAHSAGLDEESIEALRVDSLVVTSAQDASLLAPAHDVLEDWAILRWIEQKYLECHQSAELHAERIGAYPAIRRTYRKWVAELAETDASGASGLFETALTSSTLPPHVRDDMLVALLLSPAAPLLLQAHAEQLLADDKGLLRRIIHLLRVACVSTPSWLGHAGGSLFDAPTGPAWPVILKMIETRLDRFSDDDRPLLLGLIEDWGRGVAWWSPCPEGASSAAEIGWWLLAGYDEYWADEQRKRALQVISKVPNESGERFMALLTAHNDRQHRNRASGDLKELVLEGIDGMPAARDLPDVVVSAATQHLLCTEDDLEDDWAYSGGLELESLFGVRQELSFAFHPPSAHHGPYYSLFRFHPSLATDFLVDVFNHSADWYAHPRVRSVEPPFKLTLAFQDGSTRSQWANARLWNWYRGTSVGPDVLQSLLMAFEKWLLDTAEQNANLDDFLVDVLRRSDSAAVTAVVTSVATAFPHLAGETLLALLQSSACVSLDRQRLANEYQSPSVFAAILPGLAKHEIFQRERREADALPHRKLDLESAILMLQTGPMRDRVHDAIDSHRAALPSPDEQSEQDKVWRLALYRMDLRQYEVETVQSQPKVVDAEEGDANSRELLLSLQVPDADLVEMSDGASRQSGEMSRALQLSNWAYSVFRGDGDSAGDLALWHKKLLEAQELQGEQLQSELELFARGGIGTLAAVCVRDHWRDMSSSEQAWCTEIVCFEVERQSNHWDQMSRIQRNNMSADRSCAWAISLLVEFDDSQSRARSLVPVALTHPIDEVRLYAAWGVAANLWRIDGELAERCVNALALDARLVQEMHNAEMEKSCGQRRPVDELKRVAAEDVRERFSSDQVPQDSYGELDIATWFGAVANEQILAILGGSPEEPASVAAFVRAAQHLVAEWDHDRSCAERERHQRNYENESAIVRILEDYLLNAPIARCAEVLEPIVEAVERHPREISNLLLGLISAEDRKPRTEHFWSIWRPIADAVKQASWLQQLDREHAEGSGLISAVFLGSFWKDNVKHWRSLDGHIGEVDGLFDALPPVAIVLDDYVRFLHAIGSKSLPHAFRRISSRLVAGDSAQMLSKSNTVFLLELLLGGFIYGRPAELKGDRDTRSAVLLLLDALVERGSSAAFRMRDDFVTPLGNG